MRLLKAGLVQLLLISALGLASVSPAFALELPDVHVLSGETYPVTSSGEIGTKGAVVAELENEFGEIKVTATRVVMKTELKELSSLGPYTLGLAGAVEPKTKRSCESVNAVEENEVRFSGEYHVVDTSTVPLTAAILLLFSEFTFECGPKLKFKVKGPVVVKLEKVTSGTDTNIFGVVANCTAKGKQELTEYLNEEGTATKGVLSGNFGFGVETTCLRFTKQLALGSSKMLDFLF